MEQTQELDELGSLGSILANDFDPEAESWQQAAEFSPFLCVNSGQTLYSLIMRCAQAVAENKNDKALNLITRLRAGASASGSESQRLAHYFTEALATRITGSCNGSDLLNFSQSSLQELIRVYRAVAETSPVIGLSIFFNNQVILEHIRKFRRLHIIDYGIGHGFRWLCLLKDLSELPGGPPHLRLTGVEVPRHYSSIVVPIEQTAAKLIAYAKQVGVPFTFIPVISQDWELITPSQLGVEPQFSCRDVTRDDEALIVTCIYRMRQLRDEPCMDETPRKRLLKRIVEMKPMVFIQAEYTLSCNCALELRVREAVEFYSRLFGAIEEAFPADRMEREFVERVHGMDLMNMVAFEGDERKERPECYNQWQILARNSGLKPLRLKQHVYSKAAEMVESYSGSYSFTRKSNWLLIHWRQYPLSAITAWSPAVK